MTIKYGTCAKDSVRMIQSCKLVSKWMGLTNGVTRGGVGQFVCETQPDLNGHCHVSAPGVPAEAVFLVPRARDSQHSMVSAWS